MSRQKQPFFWQGTICWDRNNLRHLAWYHRRMTTATAQSFANIALAM
jgi:hypothetical protein